MDTTAASPMLHASVARNTKLVVLRNPSSSLLLTATHAAEVCGAMSLTSEACYSNCLKREECSVN